MLQALNALLIDDDIRVVRAVATALPIV